MSLHTPLRIVTAQDVYQVLYTAPSTFSWAGSEKAYRLLGGTYLNALMTTTVFPPPREESLDMLLTWTEGIRKAQNVEGKRDLADYIIKLYKEAVPHLPGDLRKSSYFRGLLGRRQIPPPYKQTAFGQALYTQLSPPFTGENLGEYAERLFRLYSELLK